MSAQPVHTADEQPLPITALRWCEYRLCRRVCRNDAEWLVSDAADWFVACDGYAQHAIEEPGSACETTYLRGMFEDEEDEQCQAA